MELKSVHYLREAQSADDAEKLIAEGWVLLTIIPTTRPNGQSLPCYVLGKTLTSGERLARAGL